LSWTLPVSVIVSIALGLAAPGLRRLFGAGLGRVLALWPLALFVYFLGLAPGIAEGEVWRASFRWFTVPAGWLPGGAGPFDVHFGFALDGLAFLFVLLITGVGALVMFYASSYLGKDENPAHFSLI